MENWNNFFFVLFTYKNEIQSESLRLFLWTLYLQICLHAETYEYFTSTDSKMFSEFLTFRKLMINEKPSTHFRNFFIFGNIVLLTILYNFMLEWCSANYPPCNALPIFYFDDLSSCNDSWYIHKRLFPPLPIQWIRHDSRGEIGRRRRAE